MRSLALLLILLVCGCSANKESIKSDFAQLKKGMTLEEVKAVIGEPTDTPMNMQLPGVASAEVYQWSYPGDTAITVGLQRGKVTTLILTGA